MKQYPTSLRVSVDIQNFNTAPFPTCRRQSSSGVLVIAHMAGKIHFFLLVLGEGGLEVIHVYLLRIWSQSPLNLYLLRVPCFVGC